MNESDNPNGSVRDLFHSEIRNMQTLIEANDRVYIAKFDAIDKATISALASMDKRLDGMNEFRNSLADQSRLFIPRKEVDVVITGLENKINSLEVGIVDRLKALEDNKNLNTGKTSMIMLIMSVIIAVSGIAIGLVGHLMK